jgi:hypothetical protein
MIRESNSKQIEDFALEPVRSGQTPVTLSTFCRSDFQATRSFASIENRL